MAQRKIIDVSGYNGTIDWKKVKKYGCDGAIIKVIRKDLGKDKKFEANYKKCDELGIPWGVYNYTYATTVAKAKSDMELVCDILDKVSKKHFKYGVWFDIEDKVQARLSKAKIAEIINAAQAVLTGRKLEQKFYRHHSGYVGGLKEVQYKTLMEENPEKAMMLAVKGMIPDNTIGRKALTRCRVYRDANHGHAAQKPEKI